MTIERATLKKIFYSIEVSESATIYSEIMVKTNLISVVIAIIIMLYYHNYSVC